MVYFRFIGKVIFVILEFLGIYCGKYYFESILGIWIFLEGFRYGVYD